MKRRIALVVGALMVLVLTAHPVAADPAAPAATPTSAAPGAVPADALGLSIAALSTNGLAVTLDAGASEEHDVIVSNHTADLRLSVKLSATDASGNIGAGPASWLAFGDDVVQLEPHAAVTVPMTVAVPHDTQPAQALAHVVATVESASSAADGSPRNGTTRATFPVAITVRGTPTATIAIADVHRDDDRKAVALVLRNYGNQGANVSGVVRVSGDRPQTLHFSANLPPTRDTTVDVPWDMPNKNKPVDVAVDVNYPGGNVASWSSTLGGPALNLDAQSQSSGANNTTVTTAADTSSNDNTPDSSAPTVSKPWYKQSWFPPLVVIAILAAGAWFVLEMKRAGQREREMPAYPPFVVAGGDGGAAAELAKQLVRLTEIIVELSTNRAVGGTPARARSPAEARAGPDPSADPVQHLASPVATPGFEARPETGPQTASEPEPEPKPEVDPQAAVLARLFELDAERRRLRRWMDEEEAAGDLWPPDLDGPGAIPNPEETIADGTDDGPWHAGP
jgi:hypothetical protein